MTMSGNLSVVKGPKTADENLEDQAAALGSRERHLPKSEGGPIRTLNGFFVCHLYNGHDLLKKPLKIQVLG